MAKQSLGEFEHQVLLAALRLGDEAYSAAIVTELETQAGREVATAAVYVALRRLEEAGLVTSSISEQEAPGGRRERRYFRVTDRGVDLLRASREQLLRLWKGIEPLLRGAR
ncbi:MAG TPA: PadR family transcriptional regulator [Longimicrobiales bacterium]|jgi:DNA-binding PadR family transcriptional regulator